MLVLSRKPDQRVRIGKDISVTVVRCTGDKVRLAFEAPPEVAIVREELEPLPVTKLHGLPKVWHLFSFSLPGTVRRELFEPFYGEFLRDHLKALREHPDAVDRFWIRSAFCLRTALMMAQCLAAAVSDRLARFLAWGLTIFGLSS